MECVYSAGMIKHSAHRIYIVYRESDAANLKAFKSYQAACDYIDSKPTDEEDYYIDGVDYYDE